MKNAKKILAVLLSLGMISGFAACGSKEETKDSKKKKDDKETEAVESSDDEETTTTESTEETTVETEPEIPDGYEEVSFVNEKYGVQINFCVPSAGTVEQTYDDKYTCYEDKDNDGYILGFEYSAYCANLDDDDWEHKVGDYEVVDSTYPAYLNAYDASLNYLTFYGGECYNGKYIVSITCTNWSERADAALFDEAVLTVAKTMRITSLGTDEFLDEDGNFVTTCDYAKIAPSMTIDGLERTPYIYIDEGDSGYPYFKVDFDSTENDHVDILCRGGYGGTLYNSRQDDDSYRPCTIAGYPALCRLSNSMGTLSAYYIIVLGHEDRETSEGNKYEEDIELYIILDGDYSDDFLKDLFSGAEHPELDERLDRYATGYMNGVIYTPGEGSTPVERSV